jgi:hypothetical protein
MTTQAGDVTVSIRADDSQLHAGMAKARGEVEKFDKASNKTAQGGAKKLGAASKKSTKEVNKFDRALRNAADSAAFMTGPLGGIASRISILNRAMGAGALGALALSAALAGMAIVLKKAVDQAEKMETSMFKTDAILKATGHSVGLTSKEIREFARELALTTLASTEGVEKAAQKLLTFKAVQGDVFKEALRLAQDLAASGFGTLEGNVVGFGKALQDPITGMMMLNRQGSLTRSQQKRIGEEFKRTGDLAKAQGDILQALREQVGGAGTAEAGGLSGAYDTLSQRVSELLENIGNNGPLQATTAAINAMAKAVKFLNDQLFEAENGARTLNGIGGALSAFGPIGMAAAGAFNLLAAGVRNNNDALDENLILENEMQKRARAKAALAKAAMEQERKDAAAAELAEEARKKAADAARALAEQRAQAMTGLREEVRILGELSTQYLNSAMTAEELATKGEALRLMSSLQIDASTKEGQAILDLITKRDALAASIDAETDKREELKAAQEDFGGRIAAVEERILQINTETEALGMATEAAEKYRIQQELINAATADGITLTAAQARAIDQTATAYAAASTQLKEVEEAQRLAEEQAQRMADAQQRFQETLASGLTNAIFNANSAGDAFAALAMEIAKAVIQAEILALIQAGTGAPNSKSGGGGSSILSALAGVASMFGGGVGAAGSAVSSVQASRMHNGGIGGQDGQRMNAPASMFINAPRFHNGLKPDEFPAILQKGEEVTPKDQVGRKNSGTTVNNFNISAPDPNAFRASQRQISRQIGARTSGQ